MPAASAEVVLIQGDQQAIPLLLRVRQFDPRTPPSGASLIQLASASSDRARIMPRPDRTADEGGELPQDRTLLYKLCVEGLLHHWDQRRGLHSDLGLGEKLRACREVALAMQADDRAEYEADKVRAIFRQVDPAEGRADRLFEQIRQRTGLLVERRPEIYAFAHLTFQEYLAASAVLVCMILGFPPMHHDVEQKISPAFQPFLAESEALRAAGRDRRL